MGKEKDTDREEGHFKKDVFERLLESPYRDELFGCFNPRDVATYREKVHTFKNADKEALHDNFVQ